MAVGAQKSRMKQVTQANVVRHDGPGVSVSDKLSLDQAIEVLQRQKKQEEEEINIAETVDAFPWDGALALQKALAETFGWAQAMAIDLGWFGKIPPDVHSIEIGPGETTNVIWGRFSLPGIDGGYLHCATTPKDGRVVFQIQGLVKRKFEPLIKQVADLTRAIVKRESIYRGKALRMRFRSSDGTQIPIPTPAFIDVSNVDENQLILPEPIHKAIIDNILTPVRRTDAVRSAGIPLKRGILIEGPYGVGKTLTANITAKVAQDNGWTYIYIERADELKDAIRFAQQYQPAVIFSEDIDRVVTGERTASMDQILNTIDGVDSKHNEIMVVLTTNHVENINKAFLRPGRMDRVIPVRAPDAAASIRLVRMYGRDLIDADEDLTAVGVALEGKIPAVIREVVESSKLSAITRTQPGERYHITAQDLLDTAHQMQEHLSLLEEPKPDTRHAFEYLGESMGNRVAGAILMLEKRIGRSLGDLVTQDTEELLDSLDDEERKLLTNGSSK